MFNKNWRVIDTEDNKQIYLFNIVTSRQLAIEAPKEPTRFLLNLLRRKLPESQIIEKFCRQFPQFERKWVIHYLKLLKKVKVISEKIDVPSGLSTQYLCGLDRQLDFFSELNNGRNKYETQLLIKNSKVAVLGLGGIGQWIIPSLIASGIGFLKCVDFDAVERRNVGSQVMFRKEDIGRLKCEVVAKFIRNHRSGIKAEAINLKLESEEDVEKVIQDSDIVLQCCDIPRFIIHRWINKACLRLKKPNLIAYAGRVGPFCIPYQTACYGCLENEMRRRFPLYDDLVANINASREIERFPALYVVAPFTGALAAKEVIAYILGIKPQTYNRFLDINPFTLKIRSIKLPRDPQCEACGKEVNNERPTGV